MYDLSRSTVVGLLCVIAFLAVVNFEGLSQTHSSMTALSSLLHIVTEKYSFMNSTLSIMFEFPLWITGNSLLLHATSSTTEFLSAAHLELGISEANWHMHQGAILLLLLLSEDGLQLRRHCQRDGQGELVFTSTRGDFTVKLYIFKFSRHAFRDTEEVMDYATFTMCTGESFLFYNLSDSIHHSSLTSLPPPLRMNFPGTDVSDTLQYMNDACGTKCRRRWRLLGAEQSLFADWENPYVPCDAGTYLADSGVSPSEKCIYPLHRGMQLLTRAGMRPFPCHGTLLGFSRQCSCIPTTGDMDMCVLAEDLLSIERLAELIEADGLRFSDTHSPQNPFIFKAGGLPMDLDFKAIYTHPTEGWMFNGIPHSPTEIAFFIIPPITSFTWSTMHGYPIRVPSNHVALAEAYYGPTWNQLEVWEGHDTLIISGIPAGTKTDEYLRVRWVYKNQLGSRKSWNGRNLSDIHRPPPSYWPEFEEGPVKGKNPYKKLPYNRVLPKRFRNESMYIQRHDHPDVLVLNTTWNATLTPIAAPSATPTAAATATSTAAAPTAAAIAVPVVATEPAGLADTTAPVSAPGASPAANAEGGTVADTPATANASALVAPATGH